MRYFLDTEYNGRGGELLSLALVPDDGDDLYLTLKPEQQPVEWVERNVVPYMDHVPDQLSCPRLSRSDAAHALENYLRHDEQPLIFADWPEDIALFCGLMVIAEGDMIDVRHVLFQLLPLSGFSTAANSKVPHNALHDARALRDHILSLE
ncbi:hypothetical protein G7078_03170 [Sphingomonas sinipercae]|uniref:Uncharacterized protein n=1 Tax=Sphingomonas sinipercae TaxID=2714944 RepID=A0A6G7ZLW0_9SPHN|nr:3'-5' exoribonuclease [Sphingomonas sinipercae]QIL01886.1 hypothetical protein G7078_03170 [Sphingomonas sinipercae]